jgi:nitroreductase
MIPILPNTLIDSLRWRYATQKFDPDKKISDENWAALEESLVLAPSSFGLQPWKFVIVQDPAVRELISAASFGQLQPVQCSHFVVFALRQNLDASHVDRHIARIVEVRGGSADAHARLRASLVRSADKARQAGNLDDWMARQVYIALGQFMTAAALLAIDTCPMEGFEPARYDDILGLATQGYTALCACAAGYRAADDKDAATRKVRFKTEEVVHYR